MESPRKFNDCYFYYYSTCTKGDNCVFRHEPSALGCETMCTNWQQGKCLDKHCKLRHMELRKNRKQIPCYWETQPGGCRKKHCPFMHKNPDALVLDSAILGVLPAPGELLAGRRVVSHPHPHAHPLPHAHPHTHAHAHAVPQHDPGYPPLPVDPLVVNFEEESDNESAPSSTPTKPDAEEQRIARTKSQELFLLEKIQAESAAFYNYDSLPPVEASKDRKIVRSNLSTKYDRLSLDELAGNKQAERRSSLDFKILSLEEIRARKKGPEAVIHPTPITINLNRKRKLSTQESLTTSGNKIIKMVRSNSIVYKKVDHNATAQNQAKPEQKKNEETNRKRTLSEQSDVYEMHEHELEDNCYEFKRIKFGEYTVKPKLIRSRSSNKSTSESKDDEIDNCKADHDSDSEVQFVSSDNSQERLQTPVEIIDVETKSVEVDDVVDLCDDLEDDDEITIADLDLDLVKNVPDVVASCRHTKTGDKDILNDIDALLNDDL
ncbi:unnamed protein product, partial [Leptidea sinapis]